jgi:di/tripeptidase
MEADLTLRREGNRVYGPGIGDNSIAVAGLFGLIWGLSENDSVKRDSNKRASKLPGDLWLVANVGEEGLGDLLGMRAVVDHFKDDASAYLVLEGMALGQIYHRALGVERYRVEIKGPGGHSWVDFGKPSAINELGKLIVKLTGIPLPDNPRTSLNVGVISGGTSVNTIAGHAQMELDLRSECDQALAGLVEQVKDILKGERTSKVEVQKFQIGNRPAGAISPDHPLVQLARSELLKMNINPNMAIGSTDANIPLSRGLPAICIGITRGAGAHTSREYIYLEPLEGGLQCLISIIRKAFEILI